MVERATDGKWALIRKSAKYHQYWTVNAALEVAVWAIRMALSI